MRLRLRKHITPIQRIKPEIQKEAREVALAEHKAAGADILVILSHDEVNVICLEMRECPNDAIRRHHGEILEHQRLEAGLVKQMGLEGFRGVHDEGVRAEVEEVCRVGVCRHCVAEGRRDGPCVGGVV